MDQATLKTAKDQLNSLKATIDPKKVIVTYDHDSDTLLLHLFGLGMPAVSRLVSDEELIRWDRTNQLAVGVQVEHFLSRVAPDHPELLVYLDVAELRGTTTADVGQIRHDIIQRQR